MQPQQQQLTPAQQAWNALLQVHASKPYFHLKFHDLAHECLEFLGRYIQEKLKEEQPAAPAQSAPVEQSEQPVQSIQ